MYTIVQINGGGGGGGCLFVVFFFLVATFQHFPCRLERNKMKSNSYVCHVLCCFVLFCSDTILLGPVFVKNLVSFNAKNEQNTYGVLSHS